MKKSKNLYIKNKFKVMLESVKEYLSEIAFILVTLGVIIFSIVALCKSSKPRMYVYVDPDTGVNYIQINNSEWMPRYDSDGNIMITTITEETE